MGFWFKKKDKKKAEEEALQEAEGKTEEEGAEGFPEGLIEDTVPEADDAGEQTLNDVGEGVRDGAVEEVWDEAEEGGEEAWGGVKIEFGKKDRKKAEKEEKEAEWFAGEQSGKEAENGDGGKAWNEPEASKTENAPYEREDAEAAEKAEPAEDVEGSTNETSQNQESAILEEEFPDTDSADDDSELDEEEDREADISFDEPEVKKKKGFFARLKEGLTKTRDNIVREIDNVFSGFSSIDDDFYEELEEILIMGDIGVKATTEIIERLKKQVRENHIKQPYECKQFLVDDIKEQMKVDETAYEFEERQSIIMVIGVNGVGKTTTVGKLASKLKSNGKKVLIAAADTFRAAAGDQLAEWAKRADVPMIGGNEGADPASVVFDAVNAAKARGVDVLIIDTAGRLHNKKNLMEELKKMNRIVDREFPDAHRENLIVLDGTTGQNALVQAREFGEVAELTGIVLTKMDGTAKGGIAVAIQSELKIPVKYIGVGETVQDLQKFDSDEFVDALFDIEQDGQEAESAHE